MRQILLPVIGCLCFGMMGIWMFFNGQPTKLKFKKVPKRDRMDLAWRQEKEMTMDPKTGDVPKDRLFAAWDYMRKLQQQQGYGKAAIPGITWTERGPNNCGGRTRGICVDLNDVSRNTLWAGGVAGGLWKSTNINAATPTWTPVDDFFQNMAITYIDQAPAAPNVMYFCTGEGNNNLDAVRGLGVWKSTNGGTTWAQLSATNNSSYFYCQKVFSIGNGDTVFVATTTGLYRSTNGGTAFTRVLGTASTIAYDIERMGNGDMYATVSTGGSNTGVIHKSTNSGTTWTALTLPSYISEREIEIAVADNDNNTVWGLVENAQRVTAIIRTTNGGTSWDTTATFPSDADPGIPGGTLSKKDISRGQAWYDLSIAVDPNNANVCFVGGIDLFKTSNGGSTWSQISHWYGGFGFQEVHADQHYALFSPGSSSIIYFANDGGVYRSANATATIPTISTREIGYNTTQFYACDIHPTAGSNHYLAGSQDNGSHRFNAAGINSTTEVTGGDGAFCHIDQNQPQFQYTSYVYNNYYRSTNTGSSFNSIIDNDTGRFINPTDYDDANNILYAAKNGGTYYRWDNASSSNGPLVTVSIAAFNSSTVSAIKVSPNTNNRVFFGTGGGRIVRVDNANTASPTATHINASTTMPGSYLSNIDVQVGNDSSIILCYSNYGVSSVWLTRNAGTTWTAVEGNLPDMPIRWVIFNPNNPNQALAATELGVWSTDLLNGTATDWQPTNSGLANVRCDMIQVRASDKTMIVATHGRGLYSSNSLAVPTALFISDRDFAYPTKNIQFTSTSSGATSYLWNFGDGTTSTLANPVKSYTAGGTYTVTLTINGGASTTNKPITVMPYRGTPYAPSAGGNFETNSTDFYPVVVSGTAFERGNSTITGKNGTFSGSNAWVTGLTATNYADNTVSYLYTPSFNCTATGTYTVRFYAKNIFEINYDGYRVEYSLNGGDTWTPLGTAVAANWYDFTTTANDRPFPANQPYFNATNATFTLKSFATSVFQGNNRVAFRFVFASDGSSTAAGLAIDDFEILGPTNIALPVDLKVFTASRLNTENVLLKWITASEKDNAGFEIERKLDWNAPFEKVAFVKGKGTTSVTTNYQLQDANNQAYSSFYRLKQIDHNGDFQYSHIIVVAGNNEVANDWQIKLWPTHAENEFVFQTPSDNKFAVKVINNRGQLVEQLQVTKGERIQLQALPTGIYYAQFTAEGKSQVVKLLIK